jgi:predicted PurR-regulated permease PerM
VGSLPSRFELVGTTAVIVLTVLVVLGIAGLLYLLGEILLLVLMAAILATGLHPLVAALERRAWTRRRWRLSRTGAITAVYLGVLLVLGLIGSVVVTPVVSESRQFLARAPDVYGRLRDLLAEAQQRYAWLPDFTGILDRLPHEAGRLTAYLGTATGVAFRLFGGVVSAITILVLSFYMVLEGPEMKRGLLEFFPATRHRQIERLLEHVGRKFGGWLRGQLFLGLVIGVAAGAGTWLLGLPYPFLLGVAAGVTELIPLIGPVLGAIPAVLIALFIGPAWRIAAVIVFFVLIQQTEGNVLVPRVMKQAVGLSPLLTLIAIMVGANLMGIIGALLAVPVAAALQAIAGEVIRTFWPRA